MPSNKWNDALERKFLLTVIFADTTAKAPNWHLIAERMDEGFSWNALRQHFDKMKKEAEAQFGEFAAADEDESAKAKKRITKPETDKGTARAGRKRKAVKEENVCAEGEKGEHKKAKDSSKQVKVEDPGTGEDDEDDDVI